MKYNSSLAFFSILLLSTFSHLNASEVSIPLFNRERFQNLSDLDVKARKSEIRSKTYFCTSAMAVITTGLLHCNYHSYQNEFYINFFSKIKIGIVLATTATSYFLSKEKLETKTFNNKVEDEKLSLLNKKNNNLQKIPDCFKQNNYASLKILIKKCYNYLQKYYCLSKKYKKMDTIDFIDLLLQVNHENRDEIYLKILNSMSKYFLKKNNIIIEEIIQKLDEEADKENTEEEIERLKKVKEKIRKQEKALFKRLEELKTIEAKITTVCEIFKEHLNENKLNTPNYDQCVKLTNKQIATIRKDFNWMNALFAPEHYFINTLEEFQKKINELERINNPDNFTYELLLEIIKLFAMHIKKQVTLKSLKHLFTNYNEE